MPSYNVRIKQYPDGTVQLMRIVPSGRPASYGEPTACLTPRMPQCTEDYLDSLEDDMRAVMDARAAKSAARKESKSLSDAVKRAKSAIYDLAKSNHWDYWCTWTLSPATCDRYDYDAVLSEVRTYGKYISSLGCKYLIIPEQHKDGAWHLHGLVSGPLPVRQAVRLDGTEVYSAGQPVYNGLGWHNRGRCSAVRCDSSPKIASYLTKYMTKSSQKSVPKGRKRYLCTRGLARPAVTYDMVSDAEWSDILSTARYIKSIDNIYGNFCLVEF